MDHRLPSICIACLLCCSQRDASANQGVLGSAACPCLDNNSTDAVFARQRLTAISYPVTYGLDGCRAYDEGFAAEGCSDDQERHCRDLWCYIDSNACSINKTQCEDAGGVIGSLVSPFCRTQSTHPSLYIKELYYSYTTCGNLNRYDENSMNKRLAGRNLLFAIKTSSASMIWQNADEPSWPQFGGFQGPLIDVLHAMVRKYDPPINVTVVPFGTEASHLVVQKEGLTPGAYTACANDVAVGLADVCVAAFWQTQELHLMTDFLPSFDSSDFYLFCPTKKKLKLNEILRRPFAPFATGTWACLIGYLAVWAIMNCLISFNDPEEFPYPSDWRTFVVRLCKSCYISFGSILAQSSQNRPLSVPAKFSTIGLGLFVVIVVSSYTANLASLLVKSSSGRAITSIDDAIRLGSSMCVPNSLVRSFSDKYPEATGLVRPFKWFEDAPRRMHAGTCDVALLTEREVGRVLAGEAAAYDCKAEERGDNSSAWHCLRDADAKPDLTRDCGYEKVGDVVISIQVAMPVANSLSQSLGWGLVGVLNEGLYALSKKRYKHLDPVRACLAEAVDVESDAIPVESMYGTLLLSFFILFFAASLRFIEVLSKRDIREWCSCGSIRTVENPQLAEPSAERNTEPTDIDCVETHAI